MKTAIDMSKWRIIPGHPCYTCSNSGDIVNMATDKPVNKYVRKDPRVTRTYVWIDGSFYDTHILFARTWVPNPENKQYPMPYDDNWLNLTPSNWYWSSIRAGMRLTAEQLEKQFNVIRAGKNLSEYDLSRQMNWPEWKVGRFRLIIQHMEECGEIPSAKTLLSDFRPMRYVHKKEKFISNNYEINPWGIIYNKEVRGYIIGYIMPIGYLSTQIKTDTGSIYVYIHKCVAETFLDNTNNLPEINHKNAIKFDPCLCNLEYVTHKENMEHMGRNDLVRSGIDNHFATSTEAQIHEVCKLLTEGKLSLREISRITGASLSVVTSVRDGNTWIRISSLPQYNIKFLLFSGDRYIGEDPIRTERIQKKIHRESI